MQISSFFKQKLETDCFINLGLNEEINDTNVSNVYTFLNNLTDEHWFLQYNKEVLFHIVDGLGLKSLNSPVPEKLIIRAHSSVLKDLQQWFWNVYALIVSKFGEEYVNESLIWKLYFVMRNDLHIKYVNTELNAEVNIAFQNKQNKVSIVVASRNYGIFLQDCLNSCLKQSIKPHEVIYVDDGSTDNSINVARKFKDSVHVVSQKHKGVCTARNLGVSISSGDILIHVDGDDILTYDFLEKHCDALNKNTSAPFAYGPVQRFGADNAYASPPEWKDVFIWDQNICNTSSAIRREYFDASGGWKECTGGNYWDWSLFLRAARYGVPVRSDALLLYRRHYNNWSRVHFAETRIKNVRQELVRMSIGCVYSGRLPGLLSRWFKSLVDNVKNLGLSELADFVIIDNSSTKKLVEEAKKYTKHFKSLRIIKLNKKVPYSDKNAVSKLLAEAYTQLLEKTNGEIVLFLEDDITFTKKTELSKLLDTLLYQTPLYAAVSGSYRNRHCEESLRIAGYTKNRVYTPVTDFSNKETNIDIAGTGCLLFWRQLAPKYVEPFIRLHNQDIPAHDWWFTENMVKGRLKILRTDIKLKHWKTGNSYII